MAIRSYSPGHLALGRFLVASLVFAISHFALRRPLPERADWPQLARMGFVGFTFYHLALNYGEQSVSAGAASFLINTAPVWTILLAGIFLGERLTMRGWIGVSVSLVGVALIALGESNGKGLSAKALLIAAAAISASIYLVMQKRLLPKYAALDLVAWATWAGTAMMLVFAPGLYTAVQTAPQGATISLIYLGIFPAAIAYSLWAYAASRLTASRLIAFLYLVPPLSLAISFLWLGEVPQKLSVWGGFIALCGVIVANAPLQNLIRKPQRRKGAENGEGSAKRK